MTTSSRRDPITLEGINGHLMALVGKVETLSVSIRGFSGEMTLIRKVQENLSSSFSELKNNLSDVIKSQDFLSQKYDEAIKKVEQFDDLEKKVGCQEEEIKRLRAQVESNEQYLRRRQLEVHGIPEQVEDVELGVINAVRQIGVTLDRAEIDAIHRLPTKVPNRQKSIILELKSRKTRDFILSKRYSAVMKAGSGQRVFINESLSPYFKDLLRKAKDCAKVMNFKHCWYKNRKIILKKEDKSKNVSFVRNPEDLVKLLTVFNKQNPNYEEENGNGMHLVSRNGKVDENPSDSSSDPLQTSPL